MSEYNLNIENAIIEMRKGTIVKREGIGEEPRNSLFYKIDDNVLYWSYDCNKWDESESDVTYYLQVKFKIIESEPVLKEVKFYKVFDISDGTFSYRAMSKKGEAIDNFKLSESYLDEEEKETNELAHTAYFNEKDEVVKYVLPSGEEIVVLNIYV